MPIEYEDFTVSFTSLGEGRFHAEAEGAVAGVLDLATLPTGAQEWPREPGGDRAGASPPGPPLPEEVGRHLYEFLFRGAIEALFESRLGQAQARRRGLRIVLRFDAGSPEVERLGQLPWELLFRKESQQFLALDPKTPVVRRLGHSAPGIEVKPLRKTLRVLVATGAATRLAGEREKEAIKRCFEGLPVEVTYLENVSRDRLSRLLARERSHVLHLLGLESFDASIARCSPSLRLVFLTSRPSGEAAVQSGPPSVFAAAETLLLAGAPAVLAMPTPLRAGGAVAFTQALYRGLTAGSSLAEAVSAGRGALYAARDRTVPVLFSGPPERVVHPMSKAAFSTVWTALGLLVFSLSFNAWSQSQGWDMSLPGWDFKSVSRYAAAIYGIVLCVPLLALLLAVTHRHLHTHPGKSFANRLPSAFRIYPPLLGPAWRTFQATFFFLFLLFPMASQVHFNLKMSHGGVWDWSLDTGEPLRPWTPVSLADAWHRPYVFAQRGDKDAGQWLYRYFPFWEPLFFLLCELALFTCFASVCRGLFFGRRRRRRIWRERRA